MDIKQKLREALGPYMVLKEDAANIIPLRLEILRPGRPIEKAHFDGDNDMETFHFALRVPSKSTTPICCVSYMLVPHEGKEDIFQLRGMATAKEFQGKGCGAVLVTEAEEIIFAATGINAFWCKARQEAIGFYEKLGWKVAGDVFHIDDVGPHVIMTKGL